MSTIAMILIEHSTIKCMSIYIYFELLWSVSPLVFVSSSLIRLFGYPTHLFVFAICLSEYIRFYYCILMSLLKNITHTINAIIYWCHCHLQHQISTKKSTARIFFFFFDKHQNLYGFLIGFAVCFLQSSKINFFCLKNIFKRKISLYSRQIDVFHLPRKYISRIICKKKLNPVMASVHRH